MSDLCHLCHRSIMWKMTSSTNWKYITYGTPPPEKDETTATNNKQRTFGEVLTYGFRNMLADRPTDRERERDKQTWSSQHCSHTRDRVITHTCNNNVNNNSNNNMKRGILTLAWRNARNVVGIVMNKQSNHCNCFAKTHLICTTPHTTCSTPRLSDYSIAANYQLPVALAAVTLIS